MKIVVLGGHGFVGKNVVEVLRNSKHDIIPLSLRDGLDLTDESSAEEYFFSENPDIIVNCAAKVGSLNLVTQQAAEIADYNMRIILNTYKIAHKCIPKVCIINPVANCAFPGHLDNYTEHNVWNGPVHQSVLSYGSTRRMVLVLSECYRMQFGLRSINFFVPNMYGPYDSTDPNKAHALNALISKIIRIKAEGGKELEVWGRGIAIREWLFAKDFGRILKATLGRLEDAYFAAPVNVAQNYGLSIRELVELILSRMNFNCTIKWNSKMPDGTPVKVMNNERFKKVFPKFTFSELESGIKETIQYYESLYC